VLKVFLFQLNVDHGYVGLIHIGEDDQRERVEDPEGSNVEVLDADLETLSQVRIFFPID
jgi:hypothetical protein